MTNQLPTPCAKNDLPYPRPEPAYDSKRRRDLSPFAAALDAVTPEQAERRENLISGKTIPQLQNLMDHGELGAVDLALYYIDRIRRYDIDRLNAVLELNPDALTLARALDTERTAGRTRGPLHGIPVLLKDNIATGDKMRTTAGAAALLGWAPDRDAFQVARLRAAGALILGKTNMSEWANWMDPCMPNGFSTNGGQTRNPYGPYDPSGSSSGSAVAVAADLATVSVGSETSGSIISPALATSIVGLKTSMGLISRDHVIPLMPQQDVTGPMGRTVTDVAVLLGAMAGPDANDPTTTAAASLTGLDFTQFLAPETWTTVRVGVPVGGEDEPLFRAAAAVLQQAGVTVVEVPAEAVPQTDAWSSALCEYAFRESLGAFLGGLGDDAPVRSLEEVIAFNNADPANRAPHGQGRLVSSNANPLTADEFDEQFAAAQAGARAALDNLFDAYGIDLVISDVAALYAVAGYPALAVPAGYGDDGRPRGVVFTGGFLSEPKLLAVGHAYEMQTRARINPTLPAAG